MARSLFDPGTLGSGARRNLLERLERLSQGRGPRAREAEILAWTSRDDQAYGRFRCEPSASVWGPLAVRVQGGRWVSLAGRRPRRFELPAWVEADGLSIRNAGACGILAVEKGAVAARLAEQRIWERIGVAVVSCGGIPAARTRRLLHRLRRELDLPVCFLGDCDTWGYFVFSVLKRGMVIPGEENPFLAVRDARFLGLQAGQGAAILARFPDLRVRWERCWDGRLRALARYPCFRTAAWRRELGAFRGLGGAVELEASIRLGAEWLGERIVRRTIEERSWLP